jgi:hypothetical protein
MSTRDDETVAYEEWQRADAAYRKALDDCRVNGNRPTPATEKLRVASKDAHDRYVRLRDRGSAR